MTSTEKEGQHHHALFRRQVCTFLSKCADNDPILKEMESCLGRYALQHDTGLILNNGKNMNDAGLATSIDDKDADNEEIDMRVPPYFIHCHGCGSCLKGRVRVQSIARGRTRRRRASRKLAAWKKAQARESQHHQQQRSALTTTAGVEVIKFDEKEAKRLFCVTDGNCKNIVVQTCDHCGVQRKMQGMPANKQQNARKLARTLDKRQTGKSTADGNDGDYLALPAKKKTRSDAAGFHQSPLVSSLASKKKKKKKKPERKSGLMNFLSSLNH